MQPDFNATTRIIKAALAEDIGAGDITTQLLIPETLRARLAFVAREPLVCCGLETVVIRVFSELSPDIEFEALCQDGERVKTGETLAIVEGLARPLLTAERTALNLLQRMCGVATLTSRYVEAVHGTGTTILDTRKTMPGLRELDKYAVRAGGAQNHRMRLDDMILIKDNHIALAGGLMQAVSRARGGALHGMQIEVECETLLQVDEALGAGADRIMLDNMSPGTMQQAVAKVAGKVPLEASGNVSLETVAAIAGTGVDYISVGKLTHSALAVDIGLDVHFQ